MRVLLVTNLYPPSFIGGYELAARDVARMLAARGHQVTVLSSPALDGAADPQEGYAVLRGLQFSSISIEPMRPREQHLRGLYLSIHNLDALRGAMAAAHPDVVLSFNLIGLGVLGLLRFLEAAGVPHVAFIMDNWFAGLAARSAEHESFCRLFAMDGDLLCGARVIGCSHSILGEVSSAIGAAPCRAVRIPAWVEVDGLTNGDLVCGNVPRFLFASRVAPHKGIQIVVEAAALLRERGRTDFAVDVLGAGLVAQAVQNAHARHVEDLVRYEGTRTKAEMLQLYGKYDALLFATWEREPSGFVTSEAAASGCVPIMTATMGGAEYFLDGHDCIKIARSAEGLAEAMLRIMDRPAGERLAWRNRVRRNARRLFGAEGWYDRIEQILRESAAEVAQGPTSPEATFQAFALLAQQWSAERD